MEHKRLVARVLVFFLTVVSIGGTSVLASAPAPGSDRDFSLPDAVQAESGWEQVGGNGLGDVDATEVSALAEFGGYLYAGTHNATDGALILRSPDGVTWTPVILPGFGIPHDTAPPAILDLTVYGSYLYASTGGGQDAAMIWRTSNGVGWLPVVNNGFSDPETVDVTVLAEFNGMLYAGASDRVSGGEIWRSYSGDSNQWVQDSPASLVAEPAAITGFAAFEGAFYAAIESDGPAQIWRTYGGSSGWTAVVSDGFGNNNPTTLTGGMAVFGNNLYVGAGNTANGVQLWRSSDGDVWEAAAAPGSADTNNKEIESLFGFGGELYAGVRNEVSGIEVWHSADGTLWEQSNLDGFGDSGNAGTNQSNATAAFLNRLFVGTANAVDGGELWRLTPASLPSYGLVLSPGSTLSGLPGTTVTHTLTLANTGSMTDTYSLTFGGNTWATSLSATNLVLAPGASAQFDVSVSIPPGALATDADTVSVTATSQGDPSKSATAQLTTGVLPSFDVALSADDALTGLPGAVVTYTLALTNSGGMTDTYTLTFGGNNWETSMSASNVPLAPGSSESFQATVTIPVGAADGAVDMVTVTATSQGDGSVSDAATLTTTCVAATAGLSLYLPLLMQNAAGGP